MFEDKKGYICQISLVIVPQQKHFFFIEQFFFSKTNEDNLSTFQPNIVVNKCNKCLKL